MNVDIPDKALADAVRSALLGDHRHDAPLAGVARETLAGLMPQLEDRMRDVAREFLASADFAAQIERGLADAVRKAMEEEAARVARRRVRALHDSGRGLFDAQAGDRVGGALGAETSSRSSARRVRGGAVRRGARPGRWRALPVTGRRP